MARWSKNLHKAVLKKIICFLSPRLKTFECGSVGRQFLFFLQTELNGRDFKYELKKGMTFISVHFPFNSSSICWAHSQHFLREIQKKLTTESENIKTFFFGKTNKEIWVGGNFSGSVGWQQTEFFLWSARVKRKIFLVMHQSFGTTDPPPHWLPMGRTGDNKDKVPDNNIDCSKSAGFYKLFYQMRFMLK